MYREILVQNQEKLVICSESSAQKFLFYLTAVTAIYFAFISITMFSVTPAQRCRIPTQRCRVKAIRLFAALLGFRFKWTLASMFEKNDLFEFGKRCLMIIFLNQCSRVVQFPLKSDNLALLLVTTSFNYCILSIA